jgi:hypothetical protein
MVKTGMLKKGDVNFYIIPRNRKIYSPHQKRELTKEEIKQTLYDNLKDKSYLTGIPKEIIVHQFKFNGVWGFDPDEYIKNLKQTNETFTGTKGIIISDMEAFCFYKANISIAKRLGIKPDNPIYASLAKLKYKIESKFEQNPSLREKYELAIKRKLERKEQATDGESDTDDTNV